MVQVMRLVVRLATVLLASCSPLLGIEDPAPRRDDGGIDAPTDVADDASIDAPPNAAGNLVFTLASLSLARHQTARLHVKHMHDGTMEDVTDRVTLASGDDAIATSGGPGQVSAANRAGVTTITATLGDATPAMIDVTVKDVECHPVINEFTTGNGTGAGASANEFIELYNPCVSAIDVANWTLNYRGGSTIGAADSNQMVKLSGAIPSGEFRLYGGSTFPGPVDGSWIDASGMGQTVGAIGLRNDNADLIDSVAYGAVDAAHPFAENSHPIGAMANGMSASRLPYDGKDDDDNNSDFAILTTSTPGALNVP